MKVLATVDVTSCSAERVMSRVRIIKNRLRSMMLDDWFSALTILASEHDIVDSLNSDEITGRWHSHQLYSRSTLTFLSSLTC